MKSEHATRTPPEYQNNIVTSSKLINPVKLTNFNGNKVNSKNNSDMKNDHNQSYSKASFKNSSFHTNTRTFSELNIVNPPNYQYPNQQTQLL